MNVNVYEMQIPTFSTKTLLLMPTVNTSAKCGSCLVRYDMWCAVMMNDEYRFKEIGKCSVL